MSIDENKYSLILFIVFFLLFSIISLTNEQLKIDEKNHHLLTLNLVQSEGISALLDPGYSAANTPLPYFIASLDYSLYWGDIDFRFARTVNILVSALFFLLLSFYISKQGCKVHWL